jgi:hypothetical protein
MRWSASLAFVGLVACGQVIKPVPVPPRPPTTPFWVGLTFSPFTEIEWGHFSAWPKPPLWRVQVDQAWIVQARGVPYMPVAVAESDASIAALLPTVKDAKYFEAGNEANFGQSCTSVHDWLLTVAIPQLRAAGLRDDQIITPGVGNIDDDTLAWLQCELAGLPSGIVAGVHFYSNWQGQEGKLLAVLNGRAWAMTEAGMNQPTPAAEQQAVPYMEQVCRTAYDLGAIMCIGYQTHDAASGPNANFGIFRLDGSSRPWEQSLIGAIR